VLEALREAGGRVDKPIAIAGLGHKKKTICLRSKKKVHPPDKLLLSKPIEEPKVIKYDPLKLNSKPSKVDLLVYRIHKRNHP
jgi:hypothetical protein